MTEIHNEFNNKKQPPKKKNKNKKTHPRQKIHRDELLIQGLPDRQAISFCQ
jgi:hypothetical protein